MQKNSRDSHLRPRHRRKYENKYILKKWGVDWILPQDRVKI